MAKKQSLNSLARMARRVGQFNVVRKGVWHFHWHDLYHLLLTMSWPAFLGLIWVLYAISNAVFALAYLAGGNCIHNARPGSFQDAFFFSVQTMATIGYGAMYPSTAYANWVVTLEAMVGLLGVAMVTGLAFARFSRPTARVLFSRVAVIRPYHGVPTLMFRTANLRYNQILEAQMSVTLVRNEISPEGEFMRRFYDLNLVRNRTPVFALSWTVMHAIDETSPLYGATPELLAEQEIEIVVTMTGLDETVSQTVHARHSFIASEILWNMRFVDVFSRRADGPLSLDYSRFHDVVPVEPVR
jgi:inward rectifier potassium channel